MIFCLKTLFCARRCIFLDVEWNYTKKMNATLKNFFYKLITLIITKTYLHQHEIAYLQIEVSEASTQTSLKRSFFTATCCYYRDRRDERIFFYHFYLTPKQNSRQNLLAIVEFFNVMQRQLELEHRCRALKRLLQRIQLQKSRPRDSLPIILTVQKGTSRMGLFRDVSGADL